jgi:ketosteroid isomerase-like protein
MTTTNLEEFEKLLKQYNEYFYNRDIESLRNMYVADGHVIYFDNHANCDSSEIEVHLSKIQEFFSNGTIVELDYENLTVYQFGNAACMVVTVRYSNNPKPGVRSSFFLERHDGEWKIRHIHFSTDPNEMRT